jgi:hypothetical protein
MKKNLMCYDREFKLRNVKGIQRPELEKLFELPNQIRRVSLLRKTGVSNKRRSACLNAAKCNAVDDQVALCLCIFNDFYGALI